ncbi:YifB family Mg chelatase-like AAA ATPase [Sulfurimonas sp. SAG-AH-194-I05]|nr:YifB family Mg chelatase-like AAA ATPase [Sulfurimonas sp. SAG-AH-194-I05]MDF1875358.1 YifB family Mg chelatase-like AAA ATPase [Sulfurimonas sp. SAG-AH-194-I05]
MKTVNCATYEGLDAKLVHVESTLTKGLPSFSIVGMASTAITEAKERVKSALLSNDFSFPPKRITINLAPSDVKKEGSQFDLSIALLIALDSLEDDLSMWTVFGELGLDGAVKENIQLFALMLSLANQKLVQKVIVPHESLHKLSKIPNIEFYGVRTLNEAIVLLKSKDTISPSTCENKDAYPFYEYNNAKYFYLKEYTDDFIDVKGQEVAKRAALIAACGFHNIILEGSPGCGKSMIAKRLRYILPPMGEDVILEKAKLQALEGIEPDFKPHRLMRNPHHSSTQASIFGGGSFKSKIGEIGLAHQGILFFDELPHFSKNVLEALREPLEDAKICISRVNSKVVYPTDFLFIGAMNPCPCGNLLNSFKECRCSDSEIKRYKNKLSDPFLDRMDLNVVMQNTNAKDSSSFSSKELHKIVVQTHIFMLKRGQSVFNAKIKDTEIDRFCVLNEEAKEVLDMAIHRFGLSFRSIKKVQKVSRTIADIDTSEMIEKKHILEALSYRKR